eukprot:scaffold400330_cov37-Prasinocladus_malaysianus.AAC.1
MKGSRIRERVLVFVVIRVLDQASDEVRPSYSYEYVERAYPRLSQVTIILSPRGYSTGTVRYSTVTVLRTRNAFARNSSNGR